MYQVVSKAEFPAFFTQFMRDAEAETGVRYKMRFANIIHRTVLKLVKICPRGL